MLVQHVIINDAGLALIDPEFAFPGPAEHADLERKRTFLKPSRAWIEAST